MITIKAHFDGSKVVIPPEALGLPPGDVLLIFEDGNGRVDAAWMSAQEQALAKVWENDEDAEYDRL